MSEMPPPKPILWRRVAQFFSDNLAFLLQLTSLLTVAGFFVVHTYLDKMTGLFTYEVNPVIYIAAGLNMLGGVLFNIVARIIPDGASAFVVTIILIFVFVIILLIINAVTHGKKAQQRFNTVVDFFGRLANGFTIAGFLVLAALLGMVYGVTDYGISPRAVGGGAPAKVVLVFKPTEDFYALGLPLSMDTTHTLRSQPVDLLMELRNGLLVRDLQMNIPFIVGNDVLFSVIDAKNAMPILPLPSTPTLTPTPMPTTTIAPTVTCILSDVSLILSWCGDM